MGLSGTLRTMELAELLQWLANSTKTGILKLERERMTKTLGFLNGKVCSVESNDPSEHLGQFMLAYGKLDAENLKKAFATQEKVGLKLGEILVQVNLVRKEELDDMLRIQAVEILYNLFLWEEGNFRFDDLNEPLDQGLSLDPSGVIMEGVYRFDEWNRWRKAIPNDDTVLGLKKAWEPASDEEKHIASLVGERKTVGEICYEFRTSKFHTYGILFDMYSRGLLSVETVPERPDEAKAPKRKGFLDLYEEAMTALRDRRYEDALPILESVLSTSTAEPEDKDLLKRAEQTYCDILLTRFIDTKKVPRLNLPPELLTEKKFNPAEGYLVSRVDGSWDVASIIRISPIPESEALGIFKKFIDQNIIILT